MTFSVFDELLKLVFFIFFIISDRLTCVLESAVAVAVVVAVAVAVGVTVAVFDTFFSSKRLLNSCSSSLIDDNIIKRSDNFLISSAKLMRSRLEL